MTKAPDNSSKGLSFQFSILLLRHFEKQRKKALRRWLPSLHSKGTNVSVSLQMVTMLVTAVIPGIRSTKQDNNSSKQLSFCQSCVQLGRRRAGAGARHCWARHGHEAARHKLHSWTRMEKSLMARGPQKSPLETHGDLGKLPDRL